MPMNWPFSISGAGLKRLSMTRTGVLIARENLGDLILTGKFQSFIKEQHFQPVFCRRSDPESKGKVENVVKYVKENFLVARVLQDIPG